MDELIKRLQAAATLSRNNRMYLLDLALQIDHQPAENVHLREDIVELLRMAAKGADARYGNCRVCKGALTKQELMNCELDLFPRRPATASDLICTECYYGTTL